MLDFCVVTVNYIVIRTLASGILIIAALLEALILISGSGAGLLSAGLSSIFPIMMLAPELISDYRNGEMQTGTPLFKILTGIAALVGLTIPILGKNPVVTQIASQVTLVFVLPLVILLMIIMLNKRKVMGEHRPGMVFTVLMALAFVFACVVSYTGIVALGNLL